MLFFTKYRCFCLRFFIKNLIFSLKKIFFNTFAINVPPHNCFKSAGTSITFVLDCVGASMTWIYEWKIFIYLHGLCHVTVARVLLNTFRLENQKTKKTKEIRNERNSIEVKFHNLICCPGISTNFQIDYLCLIATTALTYYYLG